MRGPTRSDDEREGAQRQLQEDRRGAAHLAGDAAQQARVLRRLHQELLGLVVSRRTAASAARPATAGRRRVRASARASRPTRRSRARSGTRPPRSCRRPTRRRGRAASWSRRASRRSGPSGATSVRWARRSIRFAVTEQTRRRTTRHAHSNFIYHGWPATAGTMQQNAQYRAALSYVTGAHSFKVGYQGALHDRQDADASSGQQISYRFNNGVPNQLTQRLGPTLTSNRTVPDAFFVQDQWTRARLTLQGGLRYEHVRSFFPEGENGIIEAHRFGPAFTFPRDRGRARLQRHHAAHGRVVRRVRQRQDGAEGEHEQVPRRPPSTATSTPSTTRRSRCSHDRRAAAGPTPDSRTSSPTATS